MTRARPPACGIAAMALALTCATALAADPLRLPAQAMAVCADSALDHAATLGALAALGLQPAPAAADTAIAAVCRASLVSKGATGAARQPDIGALQAGLASCTRIGAVNATVVVTDATGLSSPDGGVTLSVRRVFSRIDGVDRPPQVLCLLATHAPYSIDTTILARAPDMQSTTDLGTEQVWMDTPVARMVYRPTAGTVLGTLRPDAPLPSGAAMVIRPIPASLM